MKTILALMVAASALSLAACEDDKRPIDLGTQPTASQWEITKLFEHDGCTAYLARYPYGRSFTYVVCDSGHKTRTEENKLLSAKPVIYETINVDTVMRGTEE